MAALAPTAATPPPPVNDSAVTSQFLQARAAAAQPSANFNDLDALVPGGNGAAKPGAAATPAPPALSGSLPFGVKFDQAQIWAKQQLGKAAATAGGDIKASWDDLKNTFVQATGLSPEQQQAFQKGDFWDQMKAQFDSNLAAGALPWKAFQTALSPIGAAADVGTGAIAKGVFKVLPEVPGFGEAELHAKLNQALLAIGPEGGMAGALAKAGEAAGAEGAAATPKEAATAGEGALAETPASEAAKAPASTDDTGAVLKPADETAQTQAEGAKAQPAAAAPEPAAAQAPRPFVFASEDGSHLIQPTPAIEDQARRYFAGETGANPVQASLESLSNDQTMNAAIQKVASFVPRLDVKPDDLLEMGAFSVGTTPQEFLESGLRGNLPDDEQIGAFAMLINSTAKELAGKAQAAMESGDPNGVEMHEAIRAFAMQNKILGDWETAGTEQGRAFRARQLSWGTRDDFTKAIHDIVGAADFNDVQTVIQRIAALPDPATVNPFVSTLRKMATREGLLYGWYNWLLSPATIAKKLASDLTVGLWNGAVRGAAAVMPGSSGEVTLGETGALMSGYVGAFGDAIRAAGKAMKAGGSQFESQYQSMDGVARTRLQLLSGGADPELAAERPTNAAFEYLRMALPTTWIGAADDFAKVMNYRAELRALAYRQGVAAGKAGDELGQHVANAMNVVPGALHQQAVDAALRNTFQEPLSGFAATLSQLGDDANIRVPGTNYQLPVGRIILPFVKVPANIVKFAYRNGPLAVVFRSDALRGELAAGGATADLARARMALGTGVSLIAAHLAMGAANVTVTGQGPRQPQLRAAWLDAGNQPYSMRIGGKWYEYNRVDPIGMMLGAAADTVDLMKFSKQEDSEQLAASVAFGFGNAVLSKTYLSGLSDFLGALQEPDEEGHTYATNLISSLAVPNTVKDIGKAMDPWMRTHYSAMQAIEAKLPFLSQNIPPQRTIWGDPIKWRDAYLPPLTGTGAARAISPVSESDAAGGEPIDKWIWANRNEFPQGPEGQTGLSRPGMTISYAAPGARGISSQIQLTPQQHDRYTVLAGNDPMGAKSGLGAKDTLNDLVTGKYPGTLQQEWDQGTPADRALMVQRTVQQYRGAAKQQLLNEFPDLRGSVSVGWQARAKALDPNAVRQPSIDGAAP